MKNLKSGIITLLLLTSVVLITSQKENEGILFKLSLSYDNLKPSEVVSNFSQKLIEKGILETADLENPSIVYDKLESVYAELQPSDFDIDQVIDKSPLTNLLNTQNILELSFKEQTELALFTYYQLVSEAYLNFTFHLDEKRLVRFNDQDLPINSFESIIFDEIEKRSKHNVSIDNARMIISADEYTDFEFVTFVTGKFREMGIRQVVYKRKGSN
ncbi:MAG: hypothetical protein HWE21_06485 [Cytophagia bacterium]|nr:hypothetical protein [Cytophagia bacterium]